MTIVEATQLQVGNNTYCCLRQFQNVVRVLILIGEFGHSGVGDLNVLRSVTLTNGIFYKIHNILNIQFSINAGPVMLNGAGADEQKLSDLFAGKSLRQ